MLAQTVPTMICRVVPCVMMTCIKPTSRKRRLISTSSHHHMCGSYSWCKKAMALLSAVGRPETMASRARMSSAAVSTRSPTL